MREEGNVIGPARNHERAPAAPIPCKHLIPLSFRVSFPTAVKRCMLQSVPGASPPTRQPCKSAA